MRKITVSKQQLVETLTKNRETHQADFDLAYEGFREKAEANVEALLGRIKNAEHGQPVQLWINLEPPVNHITDYDRALQMCEWELGDEMELTEQEFQQLVQDNWSWKDAFSTSNKLYTGSASPSSASAVG
jgi:hypothetical protein